MADRPGARRTTCNSFSNKRAQARSLNRSSGIRFPSHQWATFYMKIVSPFVNVAGLRLRAKVELPADVDTRPRPIWKRFEAL
jgi:hypothetical protein